MLSEIVEPDFVNNIINFMVKTNSVRTHKKIAAKAAKILKNEATSKTVKQIAASALSNRRKTTKK